MYRIVVRMLRCPANYLMAISVAPRIAKREQNVSLRMCLFPVALSPARR